MSQGIDNAIIVYCSPGGSTRHAAQIISSELENAGVDSTLLDLGAGNDASMARDSITSGKTLLFVGSPVYVNHALPPVMQFIADLPVLPGIGAVPFVTWGGACSGIALYEMGRLFGEKGYALLGAGKVMAVHSMMWRSEKPLGQGHPDVQDDELIRQLVRGVLKKAASEAPQVIPLSDLAYQTEAAHAEMEKMTLAVAAAHMPERDIDENRCTQCDICADNCPTQAISLSPFPVFGDGCIFCFKCVRECPEQAIVVDLTQLEQRIRGRSAQFNEQPFTQIFI